MNDLRGIDPSKLPVLPEVKETYQSFPVLGNPAFRSAILAINQRLENPLPTHYFEEEFALSTNGDFSALQHVLFQELGSAKNTALADDFFSNLPADVACQFVFSIPRMFNLPSRGLTQIDKIFEDHPCARIVDQLPAKTWSGIISMYNPLSQPAPLTSAGFQVRLDMTRFKIYETPHFEKKGHAHHTPDLFLDGPWAYLIHNRKGKHILTLGFALTENGVFVNQIQSPSKTQNRDLMKVPFGYVEYFMQFLNRTFPHHALALKRGSSVVEGLKDTWTSTRQSLEDPSKALSPEKRTAAAAYCDKKLRLISTIQPRIAGLYDRPFKRFLPVHAEDARYRRLLPEAITYSY